MRENQTTPRKWAAFAAGAMIFVGVFAARPARAQNLNPFRPPSPEQQRRLGDEAAAQVLRKYREVNDDRAARFRQVCERLVRTLPDADRKAWNYRFHLIDSDEVNAFALPGGETFLFTGLYRRLRSDDEVAAVMGHEMTHVRKQHWAKAEVEREKREVLLGAGLALLHAGQAAQTVGEQAAGILGLKYSRKEEDEADQGGLENLVAAGYNPRGMLDLFETLRKAAGNGGDRLTGDFLSDHPLTSARIEATKKRVAALGDRTFPALTPIPTDPPSAPGRADGGKGGPP
jgi:beta-barrel assembly-enhancing protease